MTTTLDTPILIVGGGPVGLILALDLAQRNIPSMVIEKDPGTAVELLAKAGTYNERTMEYCRRLGIRDQIASNGFPVDYPRDTVYCTSLDGFEIGRSKQASTLERGIPPEGPEMLQKCPQFKFDPIVANAVKKTELAKILYSTEYLDLRQDTSGVSVKVNQIEHNKIDHIRAQYVVGCDGAGSLVRKQLGIDFTGKQLDYSVSAMIRVKELEKYHRMGRCERFMFIDESGTWANITAVDGYELWRFTLVGSEEHLNPVVLDIDAAIKRAFGHSGIPYSVERVVPWRRSQYLAEHYYQGRVFLAGDACHTTSPTGGHGVNTGIMDSMDLAWMLEGLVKGWGGEKLPEAYERERKPVADRNFSSSTKNYGVWVDKSDNARILEDSPEGQSARNNLGRKLEEALKEEWFSRGIGMGYRYEDSPIIIPDDTPQTPDNPSEYIQTAKPGHRAPHVWLEEGRSCIDLYGKGFVLLCLGAGDIDVSALEKAADAVSMPFEVVRLNHPEMESLYENKLVLVRPDGHVAWRADQPPPSPQQLIDTVRGA